MGDNAWINTACILCRSQSDGGDTSGCTVGFSIYKHSSSSFNYVCKVRNSEFEWEKKNYKYFFPD